jgi:3-methyladenine DNA glycosylase Mpg
MPVSLVSRLGRKSTVAEFKSVLNDAQNPRIGIAYASKSDQNRKWRFTLRPEGRSLARRVF